MEGQNAYCSTKLIPTNYVVKLDARKDQRKLGKKECTFCTSKKVETLKHFILECEAFKDIKHSYVNRYIFECETFKDSKYSYVNILTTSS